MLGLVAAQMIHKDKLGAFVKNRPVWVDVSVSMSGTLETILANDQNRLVVALGIDRAQISGSTKLNLVH